MNEQYENTIEKDGRLYRYDLDYDCWYRVYRREEYDDMSHGEKWGWLYVCLLCLVIATVATFNSH